MNNSLPLGWSVAKLSEIADVVSGGTPSRDVAEFWTPADVNWVTPTDITRNSKRVLSESSEKISFKGLRNSSAKTLPVGTILMTSRATLGEMKVSEVECCTNQGFKSLIVKPSTDKWFVFYQMKRKKPCYEKLGIGSTFLEVNKKDTDNFEIELPQFLQQQKIAKILITVDNLIDQTQSLIDKYTAVKQGMMADLFSRGIDLSGTPETNQNYGQLRPSSEEAPELYQETELGWVPKDWDVEPLGKFLSLITYGFTNPMPETDDGPWMITAANVKNGEIDYKNTRHTSLDAFNTLLTQKSKPKVDDILLTKDGTLGRLALVDNEMACINQSVALLRCNDKVKPQFLKLLLETEKYYQKMLDDAGGSTIKHIYITIVDKMLIGLPSNPKEQYAIYRKASAIIDRINVEKKYLEKLKLKKNGLMQDLLTGKVSVI